MIFFVSFFSALGKEIFNTPLLNFALISSSSMSPTLNCLLIPGAILLFGLYSRFNNSSLSSLFNSLIYSLILLMVSVLPNLSSTCF